MNSSHDQNENQPFYDGGETGCGELLLELLLLLKSQPAGATVKIRALDLSAPLEIPAWCRLTKHILLFSEHPIYLIKKPQLFTAFDPEWSPFV